MAATTAPARSDPPEGSGRRPVVLILAVVLALVAGLGGGALLFGGGDDPGPAAGGPDERVVPGGIDPVGGERVLADGATRAGFAPSCTGAVHAAVSYNALLNDTPRLRAPAAPGVADVIATPAGRVELTDAIRRAADDLAAQKEIGFEQTDYRDHPEWGGFNVLACTPQVSARVHLLTCVQVTVQVPGKSPEPGRACPSRVISLEWNSDDWRFDGSADSTDSPATPGLVPGGGADPLPAAERRASLAAGGEGWKEFAGAPTD